MNNIVKTLLAMVVILLMVAPSIAAEETLRLIQKDTPTWAEINSGTGMLLTYNSEAPTFKYTLAGTLPLDTEYSLVYYKDNECNPTSAPGTISVIGTITGSSAEGSVNIGSLPQADDKNANCVYSYPNGAKLWLVPTSDVSGTTLTWANYPDGYLFEENIRIDGIEQNGTSHLINYTDAGASDTGTTLKDVTPPAEVSGLEVTAVTDHTITWSWTNPADADFNNVVITVYEGAGTSGNVLTNYNHIKQNGSPDESDSITVIGLASSTSYTILIQTEDNAPV